MVYQTHVRLVAYITGLIYFIIAMTPGRISRLATTQLVLTNKRVLGKSGRGNRKKLSIAHKDIAIASARRGILGMIFNYGSVSITSNDGRRLTFRGIANPKRAALQINEAAEIAVLGHALPKTEADVIPLVRSKPIITRDAPPLGSASAAATSQIAAAPRLADSAAPMVKGYKDPNAW